MFSCKIIISKSLACVLRKIYEWNFKIVWQILMPTPPLPSKAGENSMVTFLTNSHYSRGIVSDYCSNPQ